MKLFHDVLQQMRALLPEQPALSAAYRSDLCAESGDKNAILFRSDTAYELGGSGKPGVSSVLFGEIDASQDEVLVYGKDLCELTQDTAFAHLTIVQLKEHSEEDLRYEQLKEIGFRLFQLYPKGYHIRISPSAGREQVRVAKDALAGPAPEPFVGMDHHVRDPDADLSEGFLCGRKGIFVGKVRKPVIVIALHIPFQ